MSKREAGVISISLQFQTEQLQAGLRTLDSHLKKLGSQAQAMGSRMSLAFTLPLAAIGRSAVKSFGDFDQAMANSIAFMGKAGEAMRGDLTKAALDMGEATEHGSVASAEALGELAKAGLSAEESMKALPIVADFATAGQMKMADATITLVQIQKSLGISSKDLGKDLSKVADVIGKASIDTTLSIQDLSSSLASQLGGTLRQAGVNIETAAALIEGFGIQGIKGAKAGTALGIVIRELGIDFIKYSAAFQAAGIAVFDSSGNYKDMIGIIKSLEDRFKGLSNLELLSGIMSLGFTKKNAVFIQSLMGMGDAMEQFREQNKAAEGSIAGIAAKMREGFNFQMKIAWNSIQNVAIALGADLAPTILKATKALSDFVKLFLELPRGVKTTVEIFAAFLTILGPTVFILGAFSSALSSVIRLGAGLIGLATGFTSLVTAATGLSIIPLLFNPITLSIIAIGAALTAAVVYWDDIVEAGRRFGNWFAETFPFIMAISNAFWIGLKDGATQAWASVTQSFNDFMAFVQNFFKVFKVVAATAWAEFGQGAKDALGNALRSMPLVGSIMKAGDQFSEVAKGVSYMGRVAYDATASTRAWAGALNTAYIETAKQNEQLREISSSYAGADSVISSFGQQMGPTKEALAAFNEEVRTGKDDVEENSPALDDFLKRQKDTESSAKKAAKAMAELNKQVLLSGDKTASKDIAQELQNAIESLDRGAFESLRTQLADSVKQGSLDGLKDLVSTASKANAAAAKAAAEQIGQNKAEAEIAKANAAWAEASKKKAEQTQKDLEAAYEESVSYWEDAFGKAIEGTKGSLTDSLKDLAIGFGAALSAELSDALSTSDGSFKSLGKMLGQSAGDWLNKQLGGAVDASGRSVNAPEGAIGQNADGTFIMPDGSSQAGTPGMGASIAAGISIGTQLITDGLSAGKEDKKHKDNRGTGKAVGGGVGAAAGSFFGPQGAAIGAQIGALFGEAIGRLFKWGPQNPETLARHSFANFVEDGFKKLGTVAFFDNKQRLKTMSAKGLNFLEGGSGAFNTPGWADKLNALPDRNVFTGLGEGLKEVLGLTEEVGDQIAMMLAVNLGGNVDNARLMVQQLGLSLDDIVAKLVDVGLTGKESWLEVESQIQGVYNAFAPGLVAVGDLGGAFQELIDSAGRGMAAIKAVKDIGVEAMEAGAKSIAELRGRLLEKGYSTEQVDALMSALAQRGIKTLQDLAEVSNRVGGGIVADINASSSTMADTWQKMADQLEEVSSKLNNLPTQIESNITLNVDANVSDSAQQVLDSGTTSIDLPSTTKKFAKGGLINRSLSFGMSGGIGIAGEAGPEFLMPATRLPDGSMGIRALGGGERSSGGVTFVVNAPGATPGMEHKIVEAIRSVQGEIISQTMDAMDRRSSRGGRY